ncbi:HD domain-containing protein [Haloprofundus salinisoli]|uniref:HD domain-containing protein n=1 Tax=Haloprofundus salinisoli TaxID=2876193 RepID=UPI001CCF5C1E|nr:HD domain-containing protein [Haloprofundus salinisoli]
MAETIRFEENAFTAVCERLPELALVDDTELMREAAVAFFEGHEDYFWTAPAASSYAHHNLYCCGERGLWIHTKMVFAAFERLVDSYLEQGLVSDFERELGRVACLLHDIKKYGETYEQGDHADRDHDVRAADWLRTETDLDPRVADAVERHMGPWYDGPEPETPLQQLVHLADMTASTKNATVGVYQPHEKIRSLYPSIPEATF